MLKAASLLLLSLAATVGGVAAASAGLGPLPSVCSGSLNSIPLVTYDASTAVKIASVANGTLSSVMPGGGATTPLLVLHLYGDSYSMGVAYGQLLQEQLFVQIPRMYEYFTSKYGLSPALINDLLDLTRNSTKAFTPAWHFEFMQGVSDGTKGNTTFEDFWRIAMIPEAIKATCSIAGAWGPATATGGLLQLRALDWGTDGPFQEFPLLATFHPNDGSFTHSSLGWVGLYGTLTGYSSSNMAVSEKVWYAYKGLDNILGYPWTLMLQDIMRFDHDIDEAISRIGGAARTCAIWLGIGQGSRPNPRVAGATLPADFKLLGDSFQQLHVYNPENFPIYDQHDYFGNLLFVNKHVQPSTESCMNELFHWGYGQLTANMFLTTITALEETGDMHIAVTDFDQKMMYISNASPMPNNTPAYNNGFIQFDMEALFNTPVPDVQMTLE